MSIKLFKFLNIWEICIFQFNLSSINKLKKLMILLNSIGMLLIVIFNRIDENEFIILNRIAVDFVYIYIQFIYT